MSGTSTANKSPKSQLLSFLNTHYKGGKLCLALSGGPDSMALFHLLLELKVDFFVAHVNHSVRSTSDNESQELALLCDKHSIDCYIKKNSPEEYQGNFENSAREIRYAFFYELYREQKFEALLLGHQQDDQAETTLKRIFEGAHLTSLASIKETSLWNGMPLWRPLLKLPKKKLLAWLDEKEIPYFVDETNFDPKYTRSRMRTRLIPTLEKEFGKQIVNPLFRLSEYASDLSDYLDHEIEPLLSTLQKEKAIDLGAHPNLHRVVFIHLMRKSLQPHVLTNKQCDELYNCYKKRSPHKKWHINNQQISMDRGKLRLMISKGI